MRKTPERLNTMNVNNLTTAVPGGWMHVSDENIYPTQASAIAAQWQNCPFHKTTCPRPQTCSRYGCVMLPQNPHP